MSNAAGPKSGAVTPHSNCTKKGRPMLTKTEVPLDFSFCCLTSLANIKDEEPRPQQKRKVEKETVPAQNEDEEDKELYRSGYIKMDNNQLTDISDLISILDDLVINPSDITYIDISINELTKIDPALCDLQNLKVLLLHGNHIQDINEVKKLGGLPQLMKLALHGNPMETTPNYRKIVLSNLNLDKLRSLDMSAVTKGDRANASVIKRK